MTSRRPTGSLDGTLGDRRPGRVRFDAAVVAAFAAAAVGIDRDVPEFSRDVGHAVVDLTVDDDPAAIPVPSVRPMT